MRHYFYHNSEYSDEESEVSEEFVHDWYNTNIVIDRFNNTLFNCNNKNFKLKKNYRSLNKFLILENFDVIS